MSPKAATVHCLGDIRHIDTHWYSIMKNAIEKETAKRGLGFSVLECTDAEPMDGFLADTAEKEPVLILSGRQRWLMNRTADLIRHGRRPILLASGLYTGGRDVSTVNINYADVTYDIIRHLCRAGRRKIAYFALNVRSLTDSAKRTGINEAAQEFGLDFSEDDIFYFDSSIADCFARFEARMASYDAAICSNDITAVYLMRRLTLKGVSVPGEIAIVGYGNTALGQTVSPRLTTTTLNYADVGVCAVDTYRSLLANDSILSQNTVIVGELILRETTPPIQTEPVPVRLSAPRPMIMTENMSFFSDTEILDLMKFEDYLSTHDVIDGKIAAALLDGVKYDSICENLHMSESMLKSHIKALCRHFGAANRAALCDTLRPVFGTLFKDTE